jgi:2',3'-cyclic-nucleotide 2'-phosphodiesterase (5'-nucleotidase family)
MDDRFALDPVIVESTKTIVENAEERRQTVIGEVSEKISARGKSSPFWQLICTAFMKTAEKQKIFSEGVFHGTFGNPDVDPGVKTIEDAWQWIPYENWLVHARITGAQIRLIMAESKEDRYSDRNLFGLDSADLQSDKRYGILFNSYDSQSGGRRLMMLRTILAEPASETRLIPVNTRESVIDFFADNYEVK